MNTVLVVAPHPDDETLGCGGTLLKHFNNGDHIHWLIMTRITEQSGFSQKSIQLKSSEIDQVAQRYQFETVTQAKLSTMELDIVPKKILVNTVSEVINSVKPNIIYLPYRADIHSDHAAVFDAVSSCTKSFRYPFIKIVRAYETLSETEFGISPDSRGFRPNLWHNISDFIEEKIKIMKLYHGEMGQPPFPRSEKNIRALATLRGSTVGCDAAEAFMTLKEVIN
jgi:N-acetylglucosamine malate deacetylase 1